MDELPRLDRSPVVDRCPRCGAAADATATRILRLSPAARDALARHALIVRRELGIATEDEAIVEAVRRVALELNQG